MAVTVEPPYPPCAFIGGTCAGAAEQDTGQPPDCTSGGGSSGGYEQITTMSFVVPNGAGYVDGNTTIGESFTRTGPGTVQEDTHGEIIDGCTDGHPHYSSSDSVSNIPYVE